jgi:hypothetical protein
MQMKTSNIHKVLIAVDSAPSRLEVAGYLMARVLIWELLLMNVLTEPMFYK